MRLAILGSLVILSSVAAIEQSSLKSYVESKHDHFVVDLRSHTGAHARKLVQNKAIPVSIPFNNRRLLDGTNTVDLEVADDLSLTCDIQFMECLGHQKCVQCFKDMEEKDIDWSIIPPGSACNEVLDALISKVGKCTDLRNDSPEKETFCKTFDSCIIWKDDEEDASDADKHFDCDSLTSCEWEGKKESYIGDGICHEFIDGCYNTEICGYDGGDCCPDTCKNSTDLVGCGSDGYFCIDPKSSEYGNGPDNTSGSDILPPKKRPDCKDDEIMYKLFQYDSFGDGWDKTEMMILNQEDAAQRLPIYDGRLEDGAEGMEYICLSSKQACYQVKVFGGYWGNEVSWNVKPMRNGAPAIASGGSPMDCEFPVSGGVCENTCTGAPNITPEEDEKYHSYHEMSNCIEEVCVIQLGMCEKDIVCASCVGGGSTPTYCLANKNYNALSFCTECNCVHDEGTHADEKEKYCKDKSREKHENDIGNDDEEEDNDSSSSNKMKACSFDELTAGTNAVIKYSECSGVETFSALLTDFNPDHFGMLDTFEQCATDYAKSKYGHKALDCMQLLHDAKDNPSKGLDPNDKTIPADAIAALAKDLLEDGENFCECSSKASEGTFACTDFIHFKTLLYESIDACKSLDAIDCAAWGEFYRPCQANIVANYKKLDFRKKKQCDYVHDGCGGVGPFPSFRRLDCNQELSEEAWGMYLDYERNCLRVDPARPDPKPAPVPPPAPGPSPGSNHAGSSTPSPSAQKNYPYKNNDDDTSTDDLFPNNSGSKKYVPPEARNKSNAGKFFKFVFFCLLAGGVYWYFKNRYDGDFSLGSICNRNNINLNQFRRTRNFGGADNDGLYDSLNMDMAQSSFQPPSLPPPPSAYDYGPNGGASVNTSGSYNGFA